MSYQTILVCFTEKESNTDLVDTAATLAHQHGAHLIGLYVVPQYRINLVAGFDASPEVLEKFRQQHLDVAQRIAQQFENRRKKDNISAEWRTIEAPTSNIAPIICAQSLMADVMLAGASATMARDRLDESVMEQVLMQSNRPVMRIPPGGYKERIGRQVLIGWNGSRECAKTIFDALPILKNAEKVFLHSVDPADNAKTQWSCSSSDMATALARHNVDVTVSQATSDGLPVGASLMYEAKNNACDLLAVGAYGHWRLREYIFGGVSRYLLQHADIPVLMAH